MLPAASGELLVESTKPTYKSGETVSVRIELTDFTRSKTEVIYVSGQFPEDPERTSLSGIRRDLDSEEGEYYFNWSVAEYARDGTYYGPIDINVTAYKSDNMSEVVAQDVIRVTIVEPETGAGLDIELPVDPMLVGVVLIALVVFVGGGVFVFRFFSDREVILPDDSTGLLGLPGLGGPGGLSALGGKTEERQESARAAARAPAGKARPKAAKGREKRKPSSRRKPAARPGPRSKPRRPARPRARPPPARPPPRPPGVASPAPRPKAPPRPGGPPRPKAPPRPKGSPRPGAPPKPRAQSFHCPTDGSELQHWPDSGYETDYYCSKCELYVTPGEQAGGGASSGQAEGVREVTCPGCHTVHKITDPTVKRITCTCGRRIRLNLD